MRSFLTLIAVLSLAAVSRPAFADIPKPGEPVIGGATKDEEAAIRKALSKIPDCWKNCGMAPTRIDVVSNDEVGNGSWHPGENRMTIDRLAFPTKEARARADRYAEATGQDKARLASFLFDMERTLVHELAHKQQLNCNHSPAAPAKSNQDQLADFMKLSYFQKRTELRNDPKYQPNLDAQADLDTEAIDNFRKAHPDLPGSHVFTEDEIRAGYTDYMKAKQLSLTREMDDLYRAHHMPVRTFGDTHAAETDTSDANEDGSEYFAMGIETLFFDPAAFCASFDPNETQWLKEHFGSCLQQFGRKAPPCWPRDDNSGKGGGGKFVRP